MFIAKYSAAGNILWANCTRGVSDNSFGHSVITDGSGNVFVTGYFEGANLIVGNDTLTNVSPPQNDIFLIKFSNLGTILWAKSAGGLGDDKSYSTTIDLTGNVYITGGFDSPSVTFGSTILTNKSGGNSDIFLAKYDINGNVLWAVDQGGTGDEGANSIAIDKSGNLYIGGAFNSSTISFGVNTITNSGGGNWDIFIAKMNHDYVPYDNLIGITIYPNPTSTILNIHNPDYSSNQLLSIFDILGRKIYQQTLLGIDISIDVSELSTGMYFYEITSTTETHRGKFIKQ